MISRALAAWRRFVAQQSLVAFVASSMVLINLGAAVLLLLIVATSNGDEPGSMSSMLTRIAIAWAVATVIVALVLIFLFRRLSISIKEISDTSRRYAQGDRSKKAMPTGTREMRALAKSLNSMARQLTSQINLLEQKRQEQEEVFQSMDVGVIAFDADQTILSVNRAGATMLNREPQELVGMRLGEITESGTLLRLAADALAGQFQTRHEFGMTSPRFPLRRVQVRVTTSGLRTGEGDTRGAVILITDITLVKQLESIRTDFAANASHELRTPITNVRGYCETLLEGALENPSDIQRFLGVIARNADRLGAIVDDMLALTNLERLDSQQEELNTEPTPVGAVIQTVRSNIANDARAQRKHIKLELDEVLYFDVNPRLAEQAIANLVSNAIRYCPEDSTVTVRACSDTLDPSGDPAVAVYVEDQGPGIPEEHLSRLFERFYRVDKARGREKGGTGLGLAIVKHIAKVHGGSVDVSSELGKGTTFKLLFPSAEPEVSVKIGSNPALWAPPP